MPTLFEATPGENFSAPIVTYIILNF